MKRTTLVAIATLPALAFASPAVAGERMPSTTQIKVMPGQDTVFNGGDPIRVCVQATTPQVFDGGVKIVIEVKTGKSKWDVIPLYLNANQMGCMYGVVHGKGDSILRARTLNQPTLSGSTSRRIRITVR